MYNCGDYNDGEVGDDSNNDDDDDEYILNKIYYLNRMRAPVMMYSRKVKQIPNVVRKTEPVHCTHLKIVMMISRKITAGTPEVCSDKSITLLRFDIRHLTLVTSIALMLFKRLRVTLVTV